MRGQHAVEPSGGRRVRLVFLPGDATLLRTCPWALLLRLPWQFWWLLPWLQPWLLLLLLLLLLLARRLPSLLLLK